MSVAKYPVMKSSNLGWVDQIPSQWDLKPFFSLFKEQKRSNKGMKSDNLLSLSYGIIKRKEISTLDGLLPASFETYQIVEPDELVFRLTDLQNDKRSLRSALVTERGIITSAYLAVEPQNINPRYASYLFRSYDLSKVFYSMGGGLRQGLNFADLRRLPILYPSAKEQQKIAQFLDYETAKIDALIDEQKRLIELLKEKRQAVISHAVTKGLDPNAPMKDSGVEWLGEVPEHWEVSKIKWKLKTTSGGTPSTSRYEEYYEGEIPWIRTTDLNNSLLFETEIYVTQKAVTDTSCRVVPINSVLIAMYGGDGTIGKHSLLMFDAAINQAVCALLPSNELRPKFLHDYIEFYRPFWMIGAESSRKDPNIGQDRIGDHFCLVPPISEQVEIEKRISDLKGKYDSLQRESVRNIRILQERRSALISAAVTGKIDVRDWQPPAGSDTVDSNASVQTERHYG